VPARQQPGSEDHRRLGVAVARLALDGRAITPSGDGWHAPEPGFRWTDGAAAIALAGARTLEVTLAMTRRYWTAAPSALAPSLPSAAARDRPACRPAGFRPAR